jgi:hypothetical protein
LQISGDQGFNLMRQQFTLTPFNKWIKQEDREPSQYTVPLRSRRRMDKPEYFKASPPDGNSVLDLWKLSKLEEKLNRAAAGCHFLQQVTHISS